VATVVTLVTPVSVVTQEFLVIADTLAILVFQDIVVTVVIRA